MPSSRGFSQPRDWTGVSCIAGGFFTIWGKPKTWLARGLIRASWLLWAGPPASERKESLQSQKLRGASPSPVLFLPCSSPTQPRRENKHSLLSRTATRATPPWLRRKPAANQHLNTPGWATLGEPGAPCLWGQLALIRCPWWGDSVPAVENCSESNRKKWWTELPCVCSWLSPSCSACFPVHSLVAPGPCSLSTGSRHSSLCALRAFSSSQHSLHSEFFSPTKLALNQALRLSRWPSEFTDKGTNSGHTCLLQDLPRYTWTRCQLRLVPHWHLWAVHSSHSRAGKPWRQLLCFTCCALPAACHSAWSQWTLIDWIRA